MSLEKASNLAISIAALVLAAVIVKREFGSSEVPAHQRGILATAVDDWRSLSAWGTWIGDSSSRVVLTEFGDYQCPFCKRFHERLTAIQDSLSEPVGILYIHFPLPSHRFAVAAANAAMCAGEQGLFPEMHDLLYREQQRIGLIDWDTLAVGAGVQDIEKFKACHSLTDPHPRVAAGAYISDSLEILYTPTVMINQWRYADPPVDSLRQILQAALDRAQ